MMKKITYSVLIIFLMYSVAGFATQSIGTGGTTGLYYPLGGKIAQIWSKALPGKSFIARTSRASVANVATVISGKDIAGFSMGNVVLRAVQGRKPFPRKMNVEILMALYPNLVQIVVKKSSSIHSIHDLNGKRISLGNIGSGTRVTALDIMHAFHIKPSKEFNLNYNETARALQEGRIEAGFIVGGVGVSAIKELAATTNIRLIPFSASDMKILKSKYPVYFSKKIPNNAYKNVKTTSVPAVWNVLVVKKGLNKNTATIMVKSIYKNLPQLVAVAKVAKQIQPKNSMHLGLPMNPGAQTVIDLMMHKNPQ